MRSSLSLVLTFCLVGALVSMPKHLSAQGEVERLGGECDAGNAEACVDLGQLHRRGAGVSQNKGRAASLYQRACDLDSGRGCRELGQSYRFGHGVGRDSTRAFSLYEQACDLGDGVGCYYFGQVYRHGNGVPKDYERASAIFELGCDLGASLSCTSGATLHHPGQRGEVKDPVRWQAFAQKACDLEEEYYCFALALASDIGMWVAKDTARANELFKKACLFGQEEACEMVRR